MAYSQLDRPVQFLKGVGPRRADAFATLGITTARDLLYHVPRRYDDASTVQPIRELRVGMDATAIGRVRSKGVIPTRKGLRIFQAVIQDETRDDHGRVARPALAGPEDPRGRRPAGDRAGALLPRPPAPAAGAHGPGAARRGRRAVRDGLRDLSRVGGRAAVGPARGLREEPRRPPVVGRRGRVPDRRGAGRPRAAPTLRGPRAPAPAVRAVGRPYRPSPPRLRRALLPPGHAGPGALAPDRSGSPASRTSAPTS